jgi:CheY-like chemotaxis protein
MTLLCIDDDLEDVELFCEAINTIDSNCICLFASDGKRGLEMLNRSLRPDFIFLDINMPLMNGQQTLEAIRGSFAFNEIPICILSTTITDTERDLLKNLGADFCIKKATNFHEFCTDLKSVLSARQLI